MKVLVTETQKSFRKLKGVRVSYPGMGVAPSLLWVPAGLDPKLLEDLLTELLEEEDASSDL